MLEKADLKTTVYHTKRAATPFEGESKDLTSHLQYSLQRIGELEQAPSAVSMQQQEEDRNSENKSALQLEQQVKELQEKKLSEVKEMEMKEDIWTLRRRRCLSPCQASWRTWRAGRPWAAGERRGAEQRGKPVVKPSGLVRTHSLSREQHGRNCSHESVISTWSCP
uniref:golgin subfamily A member 8C-like isoform X3 n=1 Tax=Macaca mulatta TaxID=9544 RepID=UPI0010A206EB|nr:golgin subfamily A member 8C-like isoform X3 [Macaca mulatta]